MEANNVNVYYKKKKKKKKKFPRLESECFKFLSCKPARRNNETIIACFYWKAFIIYQFCVSVHGKLYLVALKFSRMFFAEM